MVRGRRAAGGQLKGSAVGCLTIACVALACATIACAGRELPPYSDAARHDHPPFDPGPGPHPNGYGYGDGNRIDRPSSDRLSPIDQGRPDAPPPPRPALLSAVSPDNGIERGGTEVVLRGADFGAQVKVLVGGAGPISLERISTEELHAIVPPHAPGWVEVSAENPGTAPSMLVRAFRYTGSASTLSWCNLQHPPTTETSPGTASEPIFGRVYQPGVTPGKGQGAGILAELGLGPRGTDPRLTPGWSFVPAAYNIDVDGLSPGDLANDEYMATLIPDAVGQHDYAYRMSNDAGLNYLYCDLSGSGDGYQPASAGQLAVR